ncbi:MAG: plasmid-related protein [Formosimonas sp.]|jgi:hypothetical protein
MQTKEYLLQKFGPLLSLKEVAQVLKRSPNGIRVCGYRSTPIGQKLKDAQIKIGRRIYFSAEKIAELIDQSN